MFSWSRSWSRLNLINECMNCCAIALQARSGVRVRGDGFWVRVAHLAAGDERGGVLSRGAHVHGTAEYAAEAAKPGHAGDAGARYA